MSRRISISAMLVIILHASIFNLHTMADDSQQDNTRQKYRAGKISIRSEETLSARSPYASACYIEKTGVKMFSNAGISTDNGRTWTALESTPNFDGKLPYGYRREFHPPYFDVETGRIIRFINAMDTPNVDPNAIEPAIALKSYYLRYRISEDGGKTWLNDDVIIQVGDYTEENPFEGVWKGKNAIFFGDAGSIPIHTKQDKLLVPVQVCTVDDKQELYSPGGGFTYTDVLILIGTWNDQKRLTWEVSDRIVADPTRSTRGMIEPTLAELPDGRILVVMRGSNGGSQDPDYQIPGYKWASVSADGGKTWTEPEPWCCTDGEPFYSPSSMSQLIAHSNGRYYWVGNISPDNPQGNSPRYPLVIAEVDPRSLRVVRESQLTIDELKPEDTEGVELCVHAAIIEDRENGDLIVPMIRYTGGYKTGTPKLIRIKVE